MSDIEFHEGMPFDVEDITNAFVIIDDLMNEKIQPQLLKPDGETSQNAYENKDKLEEPKEASFIEQKPSYVSCPPPSAPPPPPPPNLDKSSSRKSNIEVTQSVVNSTVPPPIPSRSSLSSGHHGNKPPPPLPARPQPHLPPRK
ncbi:hypothetical protein TNCV_4975591 [Trichonephila clavipes]|uniref:Uncharacterized protein n=1 Tax=Trichonephila clavipes TaxID=2585209 RepID=A0A8X6SED7_TRICX|nr:hypothetical protein TNCV_4975591 [Trichonephila clavipes]